MKTSVRAGAGLRHQRHDEREDAQQGGEPQEEGAASMGTAHGVSRFDRQYFFASRSR